MPRGNTSRIALTAVLSISALLRVTVSSADEPGFESAAKRFDSTRDTPRLHRRPQSSRNRADDDHWHASAAEGLPDSFFRGVIDVSRRSNCDPRDLLAVMMRESGIRARAHNPSSDAVGLIQFLPSSLARLGWTGTIDDFMDLSAEQQLPWVEKFLRPSSQYGLDTAGRVYQAVFMPASLRQASDSYTVLIDSRGVNKDRYDRNSTLDLDHRGRITSNDLQTAVDRCRRTTAWQKIERRLIALEKGRGRGGRAIESDSDSKVDPVGDEVLIGTRARPRHPATVIEDFSHRPVRQSGDVPESTGQTDEFDLRSSRGVEDALIALGYDSPAGSPGATIRVFQRREGMREDGIAGPKTRALIAERLDSVCLIGRQ